MKNQFIIICFFSCLFFSCISNEDDLDTIIEPETGWVQHPFYQYEHKDLRGLLQLENHLLTLHDYGYGLKPYDETSERLNNYMTLAIPGLPGRKHLNADLSFPVNEKYYPVHLVEIPNSIFVYPVKSQRDFIFYSSVLEIKGEDIDPDFRNFINIGTFRGNSMELVNNFLLVGYNVHAAANPHPLKFAIMELKQNDAGSGGKVELISIKTINAPQKEGLYGNALHSIQPVNDGFVISTNFELFKLYFDGSIKTFERNNIDGNGFERYTTSFLVKDPKTNVLLCAEMSTVLDSYYSMDNGESWNVLTDFSSSIEFDSFDRLRFIHHNDELYGTYNSQIFKISITPNQLVLNELDNTGLEGHKITGLSFYQKDSLVMVSSRSGAFYKPSDELLQPKINGSMSTFSGSF